MDPVRRLVVAGHCTWPEALGLYQMSYGTRKPYHGGKMARIDHSGTSYDLCYNYMYIVYLCINVIFCLTILRDIVACVISLLCLKILVSLHNYVSCLIYTLSRELTLYLFSPIKHLCITKKPARFSVRMSSRHMQPFGVIILIWLPFENSLQDSAGCFRY